MNEPAQAPAAAATPADHAYESGDYREAQRLARGQLVTADRAAQEAGAAVLAKLRPDWVQALVLGGCTLLFAAVAVVYLS